MPRGGSSSGGPAGPHPRLFPSLGPFSPLIGWWPLLATPPRPPLPAAAVREYQRVMAAVAPPPEVTQEEPEEGAGLSGDLLELLWDPEVPRQAAALISPRFLADILEEEEEEEGREASASPKMAATAAPSDLAKMAAPTLTATRRGRLDPRKMAAPSDLPKMAARSDLPKVAPPPDLPKMAPPVAMTTTPTPSQDGGALSPPNMAPP